MQIGLVFCGISGVGFDSFGKTSSEEGCFVPHGLAHIAAACQQAGHEVHAIDLRKLRGWEDFTACVKATPAMVYGISSMSADWAYATKCARLIREAKPPAKILVGGVHVSVATDDALGFKEFDHFITGEGEITVPALVEAVKKRRKIPRLIAGVPPDLNTLPIMDRDLFDFIRGEMVHPFLPDQPLPFVSITINRGCPFRCAFCQPAERNIFGGKVRWKSIAATFAELEKLREVYHFRSLMIHDDLFIMRPKWAAEFAEQYVKRGFTAPFMAQARADIICKNPDTLRALRDAGLRWVSVGFESANQRVLDFLKKGTTVEQNFQAMKICNSLDLKVFANMMFGIPTETKEEVADTVSFLEETRPYRISCAFFTPHPGSELYEYCRENKLSRIQFYEDYRRNASGPKITGPDYAWLDGIVAHARTLQAP